MKPRPLVVVLGVLLLEIGWHASEQILRTPFRGYGVRVHGLGFEVESLGFKV